MSEIPELLPCPFCGGSNIRRCEEVDEFGRKSYGCQCANGNCWIVGPERGSRAEADTAWNSRASKVMRLSELDMSNMLRHAFISGVEAADGTIAAGVGLWPEYNPESCYAYKRILSALAERTRALSQLEAGNAGYWRSIDTAPEDEHVILATTGGHVGEALMLIDEDTGRQKWTWALGPVHPSHIPLGWQSMPPSISFAVPSDNRTGGFDGPTGAD